MMDTQMQAIVATFTPRTQTMLRMIGDGETYQVIGQRLDISVREVKATLAAALVEIMRREREEPQCWPKSGMRCWEWMFWLALIVLCLLRGCWA